MLTYPWKCTVLHCNHLGNTWKPLVLMIRHFDYCPSASEDDNQSVRSSAPVVSRCFPGGYNVTLYISRGRLAWWLLAFLHSVRKRFRVGMTSDVFCCFLRPLYFCSLFIRSNQKNQIGLQVRTSTQQSTTNAQTRKRSTRREQSAPDGPVLCSCRQTSCCGNT